MTILLEPYQLFMIAATSLAAFFGLGKLLARQVMDNIDIKLSGFSDIKLRLKSSPLLPIILSVTYSVSKETLLNSTLDAMTSLG